VHRKRSQVAVIDGKGEVLANRNVPNGAEPILKVIGGLPPGTPAAFEAGFGTGWLVQLLEDYGFTPQLAHPSRCKAIASARLKNDKVDAAILAQLLRADLLPEAWIAPPPVRALRALLRHRVHLVRLRTLLRNRIHAIVADHGHDRPAGGYWTGPGRAWLASLELPAVSREVVDDGLALIGPGCHFAGPRACWARGCAAGARPWEDPRTARWSATCPGHLRPRTRLEGAAVVSMRRRSARRPGLRTPRRATGPPRPRCLGRSSARAAAARRPARTGRRSRSAKPWPTMLAGRGTEGPAGGMPRRAAGRAGARRCPGLRRGQRPPAPEAGGMMEA
jgi:hypothetical protein